MLALHRTRQQLVKFRTAHINGLRGLLAEYDRMMPRGRGRMKWDIARVLERLSERLPAMVVETLREQWARVATLGDEIGVIERRLEASHWDSPASQRVAAIPGVGLLGVTALVAMMRDPAAFRSGREFASWLRLVPRQSGTGRRVRMLASSSGGTRICEPCWSTAPERRSLTHMKALPQWQVRLTSHRPLNIATVALPSKTARTAWVLLAHDREYNPLNRSDGPSRPAPSSMLSIELAKHCVKKCPARDTSRQETQRERRPTSHHCRHRGAE